MPPHAFLWLIFEPDGYGCHVAYPMYIVARIYRL